MSRYFNGLFIFSVYCYCFNIIIISAQSIDLNQYNLTNTCQNAINSVSQNQEVDKCLSFSTIIDTIPTIVDPNVPKPVIKINLIAQNVKTVCLLPKCNIDTMQQITQQLVSNCAQDLESKNPVVMMTYIMFAYYKPLREIICLRNTSNNFNGFCILETITNIASNQNKNQKRSLEFKINQKMEIDIDHNTANLTYVSIFHSTTPELTNLSSTGTDKPTPSSVEAIQPTPSSVGANQPTTSSVEANQPTLTSTSVQELPTTSTISTSTNIPTSSPPATTAGLSKDPLISFILPLLKLPPNLLCTDCNEAMLNILFKYFKENPSTSTSFNDTQFTAPLNSICGASFTDGIISDTISIATITPIFNSLIISTLLFTFSMSIIFCKN